MKVFHNRVNEKSLSSINEVMMSGELGFGKNVKRFENLYRKLSQREHNVAVNSASAGAFIVFSYLKQKYGTCDVYTSSLSFTSPAWAATHFGHNIIWVDVDSNLLFSSKDYLEKRQEISKENKVVLMPVLYGGVSKIKNWKVLGDEFVLIDSAHCATPRMKSDVDVFSFHPYKPICSSDGGMISTDVYEIADYSRGYRNFGRVPEIEDSYTIENPGFKFYMNNLNATIAIESLDYYEENLRERIKNYKKLRKSLPKEVILDHDKDSSYYFATLLIDESLCKRVTKKTKISKHYPMLHKMKYYRDFHRKLENLEKIYPTILNVPLYDEGEMNKMIQEIQC